MENRRVINASPTKEFFIYMITRDIDLKDAILELVDNCIDGALRLRKDNNFNGLWIKLNVSQEEFNISDNCGGIPVKIAEEYAFRFGRIESSDNFIEFSTGRFGIGMKRALFKIGRLFTIESTTQNSYFVVNINVDEWAKDEKNWSLYFDEVKESIQNDLENCGTRITVRNLYEGIANNFKLDIFKAMLKQHIQQHISASIEKGLAISINGIPLEFNKNEIFMSDQLTPANEYYTIGDGENEVKIQIIAGIGETGKPNDAGWYIYCNGRLVLSADKSEITGWGEDGLPVFHPTYARFRGFVFFDSKVSSNLPWNTTKTGVDVSSPVYINTKVKMKVIFKSVAEFLRKIKSEEDETRSEIEDIIDSLPKEQITISKRITTIPQSSQITSKGLEFPKNTNPNVTISYKKPKSDVDKVKKLLKVTSNKQVGELTFDYYLDMESDE